MRLVWHIIAKDLRQDRWALLIWMALFGVHLVIGRVLMQAGDAEIDWLDQLRIQSIILTVAEFGIGYVLALRWVQADPLSGTRMFWLTRPITAGRLFAAKSLGLLLVFGLLPIALWMPWWVSCGLSGREIGWIAFETFGWQLAVIAPALLIGSLTDDFGRAIMWSLILIMAAFAWALLAQSGQWTPGAASLPQFVRVYPGLWFSRVLVAALLLIAGFIGIAATQFHGRDTVRSILRVSVLALLVVLVGRLWLLDFSDQFVRLGEPARPEPLPDAGKDIVLSPKQARVAINGYSQWTPKGKETVHSMVVSIAVDGLPEELGLTGSHPFQTLLWDGAPSVRTTDRRGSGAMRLETFFRKKLALPLVDNDGETIAWGRARLQKNNAERAAKGLPPLDDFWDAHFRQVEEKAALHVYFPIPDSALPRLRAQAPDYVTRVEARVIRPEIVQQLPLEPGSRGTGESRPIRVVSLDDYALKLVETPPAFSKDGLFSALWPASTRNRLMGQTSVRLRPRTEVWTINQVTGDIRSVTRRSNNMRTPVNVGGVTINWSEINMSPVQWIRNDRWVVKDPEWPRHTQLVLLTYEDLGGFTRNVRGDKLSVRVPETASVAAPVNSTAAGGN